MVYLSFGSISSSVGISAFHRSIASKVCPLFASAASSVATTLSTARSRSLCRLFWNFDSLQGIFHKRPPESGFVARNGPNIVYICAELSANREKTVRLPKLLRRVFEAFHSYSALSRIGLAPPEFGGCALRSEQRCALAVAHAPPFSPSIIPQVLRQSFCIESVHLQHQRLKSFHASLSLSARRNLARCAAQRQHYELLLCHCRHPGQSPVRV